MPAFRHTSQEGERGEGRGLGGEGGRAQEDLSAQAMTNLACGRLQL